MFQIAEVSRVEMAFPASVAHLMPKWEDIPKEFKDGCTKWNELFNDWFFSGVTNLDLKPRESVDKDKALRHIATVMRSFEPKHEHKEAAVSFLMNDWFEDGTWVRAK